MKLRQTLLAGALALGVVGAACGDSEGGTAQSGAAGGATTAPAAEQTVAPAATMSAAGAAPTTAPAAAGPAATAPTKLNLNTATREQFLSVPGVGDRFVREFEEYRPYTTIAQFRRELGKYVSQDQVAAWERYLYVPVDPNKADAATLQQLPGVSAEIAGQLIAARPYASTEAFTAKLAQLTSADQATAARAYLVAS